MRNILVTGCAGFIGTNLVAKLLENKENFIVGVDNLNPYYDLKIKDNNVQSNRNNRFEFVFADITNEFIMRTRVFEKYKFDTVIHLAAQAGVGYSIEHPLEVMDINVKGFEIMVRCAHLNGVKHFIYASSSSVNGDDGIMKCPYAVSKATNELQASMYGNLYKGMKFTGLRLFTVYGERMRPDLAIYKFANAMLHYDTIFIYGDGNTARDFTYVGDVTEAIKVVMESDLEYTSRVYDVGSGKSKSLNDVLYEMKMAFARTDFNKIEYVDKKEYDARITTANPVPMERDFGFRCSDDLRYNLFKLQNWIEKQKE
jgi:UDP-glucuronate 4-epimerase